MTADRRRQLKLAEIEVLADCGKIQHQLRSISREFEALAGEGPRHDWPTRVQQGRLEPAEYAVVELQEKLGRIEREYDDLLQVFADSVA